MLAISALIVTIVTLLSSWGGITGTHVNQPQSGQVTGPNQLQLARASLGATPSAAGPAWTQITTATNSTPSPRDVAAMAYDASDGYVVLFGGHNSAGHALSDTWKFQAGTWTRLHPAHSPPARWGVQMVYDAKDGYVVSFGGQAVRFNGYFYDSNDTWAFRGGNWTDLTNSSAPTPGSRSFGGFSYDSADGYAVLYGGIYNLANGSTHWFSDTWTFSGRNWTLLPVPATAHPPARYAAMMTYDTSDRHILLFGGYGPSQGVMSDTWTFHAGHWKNLSLATHPGARYAGSATYDSNLSEVFLFGGVDGSGGWYYDTWSFHAGAWSLLTISGPSARDTFPFVDDRADHCAVLFGGFGQINVYGSTGRLADTWEVTG